MLIELIYRTITKEIKMPPKKKADSLREVKRVREDIQILSEVLALLYDSKESKEELGRQVYGILEQLTAIFRKLMAVPNTRKNIVHHMTNLFEFSDVIYTYEELMTNAVMDNPRDLKLLGRWVGFRNEVMSVVPCFLSEKEEEEKEPPAPRCGICKEEMRSELVACANGHVLHCICYVAMQKIDKGFRCGCGLPVIDKLL